MKDVGAVWSVPVLVENLPEQGQAYDLQADGEVREAVRRAAGLLELPRLEAKFTVLPRPGGLVHVSGLVSATVGQVCGVTLEPLLNEVAEEVDLLFGPGAQERVQEGEVEVTEAGDPPEPIMNGRIDLGAIATEFLLLGIDPYPRKAGVTFNNPATPDDRDNPFAALAALQVRGDKGG